MAGDRVLVRVRAEDLPLRARVLLDPGMPRPSQARFRPHRTHVTWIPLAWLVGLLVIGVASLRSTLIAGLDPDSGAERFVYGSMAAICLVGAAFSARTLLVGLAERRDLRQGAYRKGLHLLGLDGLLLAGTREHTWVPRSLMPPAVDVTGPGSGGNRMAEYAYFFTDSDGRVERFDCRAMLQSDLWMWSVHGHMPDGHGWS